MIFTRQSINGTADLSIEERSFVDNSSAAKPRSRFALPCVALLSGRVKFIEIQSKREALGAARGVVPDLKS